MADTVGLIGLGAMGLGMAQSLRRKGYALRVFDVRSDVTQDFAKEGGTACASPADVAAGCDVLISVVVNAAQTEAVLFGEQGAAAAMQAGQRVRDVLDRRSELVDRARSSGWTSSACSISTRRSPAARPRRRAAR